MNPLLEAILIESSDEVKRLLSKIPINDQDNLLGQAALHLAVSRPHHLEILLESGADVNARDRHGITPLMYASAMGNSHVAIRLLESGADPFLVDNIEQRSFLAYARARGHWTTIMDILGHFHQSLEVPRNFVRYWLTMGAAFWVNDGNWEKDLKDFHTLLEWGANPNVLLYPYGHDELVTETLAHRFRNEAELKTLISHGFTNFNHLDGKGAHALIFASTKPNHDPGVMELLLDGGSLVNHQNHNGRTALNMVVQSLRDCPEVFIRISRDKELEDRHCNDRKQILQCIRILLDRKADPCLGDKCRCACSRSGCTPSHVIVGRKSWWFGTQEHIWFLEFLEIVKETCGFEVAKQCLLDMLRRAKFQELELTHTCCRGLHSYALLYRHIEDEEIDEIMDEEKEMVEILEQEMGDVEKLLGDDFEQLLLTAIFQLSFQAKKASQEQPGSFRREVSVPHFYGKEFRN